MEVFNTVISTLNVSVSFVLYLTMIDGKVLAVITNTKSYETCCICQANPKNFNDLRNVSTRLKPQENNLNYSISPLHLWIRVFEFLLHLAYRLPSKKSQVRGEKAKEELKERKLMLQKRFREKLGLRVDYPAVGGSGNTNSGPVARIAFSKPDVLSEILELDADLVKKFATILIVLNC